MREKKQTSPFRYAIGMFGTSIPINMFKTYAAAFYVINLGLTTTQMSTVLFIYTFVDAIDNPVYGFLSDRTRTRWGRRRPWLIIGTPLLILSFIAFFTPPAFSGENSGTQLFIYMLLMYILTGTLDSLINANYGALFPELFQNDAQRAKSNAMRQAFQLVAMAISVALTPMVTDAIGYRNTAIIYGIIAAAVILYCATGCHEKEFAETEDRPRLFDTLKTILTNPKFWIFGLTNAFYSAAMALVMSGIPFFVEYRLGLDGTANTILLGTVLLVAMVGVFFWARLVKKYTVMPVWRWALIFFAAAFIPVYFANSLISAAITCAFAGIGCAGAMATMDLIGARIMDEDTRKHGLRREGMYASTLGFMNRLNGFFTSAAFLFVDKIYGFESGDVPGDRPGDAARFLLVIFPFVMMVLSVITSRFLHFPDADAAETAAVAEDAAGDSLE